MAGETDGAIIKDISDPFCRHMADSYTCYLPVLWSLCLLVTNSEVVKPPDDVSYCQL